MATTKDKTYSVGGVLLERPFKLRRLGHFGLDVRDMDAHLRFYHDLLGFKLSDVNDFGARPNLAEMLKDVKETKGYFMHYGGDHHAFVLFPKEMRDTMARARGREPKPGVDINQITWQVGSLGEIVHAIDFFKEREVPIARTGRDMPGSNWHTYLLDPDGHTNELYYGIEQIGWLGRSKPQDMYYRRFDEPPALPQMSEEAEVEEAKAKGIDVYSGFRDVESAPATHDVEGVLLPRPFKITKIGPVSLFVDDLDRSLDFYMRELGFTLTEETEVMGQRAVFLRTGTEHHSLTLLPIALRSELGFSEESTLASFGVEVGSYEQLRNAVAFLKDNGVEFKDVPEELHPGIDYAAYALDPSGRCVQIYYYMEQLGWQGTPRPPSERRSTEGAWPETLEPLSDTYADQVFQGPLG
ncbi:MAG: VOC family protein [Chloroflexi bacterium]|nr:VOC family protein [Chloroflexota bacterium]